jgi:hypothetical protein
MRRAMFSEPLLAHPAETRGVDAGWHTHPGDDDDRDQHDDEPDDEQHGWRRKSGRRIAIVTRHKLSVCALVHKAFWARGMSRRFCAMCKAPGVRAPAVLASPVGRSRGVRVHSGTARFNAGAYT